MQLLEILGIGFGLAMDAFAVSVCKGLSMKKIDLRKMLIIALYFGGFQALMPIIGYFIGGAFSSLIQQIDHWVVFVMLAVIGGKMIKDSTDAENEKRNDRVDFKTMFALALATSIDALAVGISFSFFDINIWTCTSIIGLITFILASTGVVLGNRFGDKCQNKAELIGGIILILIGIKILLEHLGLIA